MLGINFKMLIAQLTGFYASRANAENYIPLFESFHYSQNARFADKKEEIHFYKPYGCVAIKNNG